MTNPLEKYAPSSSTDMDPTMAQILELGATLKAYNEKKEKLEQVLKEIKESMEKIQGDLLPNLMDTLNPPLQEIKLQTGEKITRITIYKGKIDDLNREAAFKWLKDTANDALIKNIVEIQFGMGDNSKAEKIAKEAEEAGGTVQHAQSIHYKTLDGFVKTNSENPNLYPENPFPRDTFGVQEIKRVIIK